MNDDYSVLNALATMKAFADHALTPATKQALERLHQRGLVDFLWVSGTWIMTDAGNSELDDLQRDEK